MEKVNNTLLTRFTLLGLTAGLGLQLPVVTSFLLIYFFTLLGNSMLIFLAQSDPRLHTPMYHFLCHLSLMDICYSSITLPRMLVSTLSGDYSISFIGCLSQLYLVLSFSIMEALILAVMAWDRYVAICSPLRYTVQMNERTCHQLAAGSWICGSVPCVVHTTLTCNLQFCGHHEINQFFCNIQQLLELACTDTSLNKTVLFIHGGIAALICSTAILWSYLNIIVTILKIPSDNGHRKGFSTCASHLTVVSLFYGSGLLTNLLPSFRFPLEAHRLISVFYVALTPVLNPIIYSLRNQEVKQALRRAVGPHLK
ncbi:hypothetical protein NDU88_000168 [Pleurodeles waltl]|uniref:Olfactory receptor n=2 Tax=Pleurodeles waltl TaxID=8319 RepID=A0AAV7KP69_PLEWA|nr:hypothetical protein NDU88_000168 [Pleurodeles waltl]